MELPRLATPILHQNMQPHLPYSGHSSAPLLQLRLVKFANVIKTRRLASNSALGDLHRAAHHVPVEQRIRDALGLDAYGADARILRPAVVLPIAEITHPGFQLLGVVLLDDGAVGVDTRGAAYAGPLAAGVEEGDVDGRIGFEVVGFSRFGVGEEEDVDAAALLWELC